MKFIKIKKNIQLPNSFVTFSPKKQKRIAKKIAGDCYYLSDILLLLWRNGIDTKYINVGDYENLSSPQLIIKRDGIFKIYSVLDEFLKGVTQNMNSLCHLEIDRADNCYIIAAKEIQSFDSKEKFERYKWEFYSRLYSIINDIISKNKDIDTRYVTDKVFNDQIFEVYLNKMLSDKETLRQMGLNESEIFMALHNEDYFSVVNFIYSYIEEKNISTQREFEKIQSQTQ